MAAEVTEFADLSLSKIGDLGVPVMETARKPRSNARERREGSDRRLTARWISSPRLISGF